MNRRWACPEALHPGVLAPGKLRKIDIRRYCIPCSQTKGVLVERVAPAVERASEKEAAKYTFDGVDMRKEFVRLKRLRCWERWGVTSWIERLDLRLARRRRGAHITGHHWNGRGYITVTGADSARWFEVSVVILHEMMHEAQYRMGLQRVVGRKTRAVHDEAFHDHLRVAAQQAYGVTDLLSLYHASGGRGRAYSMDRAIVARLREKHPPLTPAT
jgi:hypothetical protein